MNIELTKEQEHVIIPTALAFLRALTEELGQDVGLAAWEQLNTVLGNDIKGKTFFAMITGGYADSVKIFHAASQPNDAVGCIKLIRQYTGLGLKEAKDTFDAVVGGYDKTVKLLEHMQPDRGGFIRSLRALGLNAI